MTETSSRTKGRASAAQAPSVAITSRVSKFNERRTLTSCTRLSMRPRRSVHPLKERHLVLLAKAP